MSGKLRGRFPALRRFVKSKGRRRAVISASYQQCCMKTIGSSGKGRSGRESSPAGSRFRQFRLRVPRRRQKFIRLFRQSKAGRRFREIVQDNRMFPGRKQNGPVRLARIGKSAQNMPLFPGAGLAKQDKSGGFSAVNADRNPVIYFL